MKKGNILLHGIGKILFCMIGSVLIIGEMIVIGNVISKISIFDVFFLSWSMLIVAFVIFLLGTVVLILFRTSNFTYNHRYYSEIENKFKLTFYTQNISIQILAKQV